MWDFSNASSKSQGLVSDVGSIFQQGEVRRLRRHSLIQGTWRFNLLKNVARYLYPNLRTNSSMDPELAEETCLIWEFHFSTKLCWSPITLPAWCLASFAFFFFPLKVIKGLFQIAAKESPLTLMLYLKGIDSPGIFFSPLQASVVVSTASSL